MRNMHSMNYAVEKSGQEQMYNYRACNLHGEHLYMQRKVKVVLSNHKFVKASLILGGYPICMSNQAR